MIEVMQAAVLRKPIDRGIGKWTLVRAIAPDFIAGGESSYARWSFSYNASYAFADAPQE